MILIADSGSTKTEWILIEGDNTILHLETIGLNPYFVDELSIKKTIVYSELRKYRDLVSEIHFFGAGCSNNEKKEWLSSKLKFHFKKATIRIESDIKAAVIATSNGQPCTVCILGTGSTFRLYNGHQIIKKYSSLSYILGDEGSGTSIAKALLRGVFYKNLSEDTITAFHKAYIIDAPTLLENVYQQPQPNRYIASFVPFCKKHIHVNEIEDIVLNAFQEFYNEHLKKFTYPHKYPVHFVGSIAYHFKPQLEKIGKKNGFTIGNVIKNPLPHLIDKI